MKKYLAFSERYLEKLVCTQVAIKNRQDKVIKIMNYNQQLLDSIEECIGPQPESRAALSLTSIKEVSLNSTTRSVPGLNLSKLMCTKCARLEDELKVS